MSVEETSIEPKGQPRGPISRTVPTSLEFGRSSAVRVESEAWLVCGFSRFATSDPACRSRRTGRAQVELTGAPATAGLGRSARFTG